MRIGLLRIVSMMCLRGLWEVFLLVSVTGCLISFMGFDREI